MTGADELDDELRARAEKLFRQDCRFVAGAATPDRLPEPALPEIAFAGRSNVGKSTLINTLMGRKHLVRASNTPGRTQQINFFDLGGKLHLVDLPGYGYAKASRSDVDDWHRLIRTYLQDRSTLVRVCVLIDARHGIKPVDREAMELMAECRVAFLGVLTKTDKISRAELEATAAAVEGELLKIPFSFPKLYRSSSVYTDTLADLRAMLTRAAGL